MTTDKTYTRGQWEAAIRRWYPYVSGKKTSPALEAMLEALRDEGGRYTQEIFASEASSSPEDLARCALDHSSLVYWLVEGNEPLEHPPPKYMSRPWHDLIADGEGVILDKPFQMMPGSGRWVIGQDARWTLIEEREGSWVLEFPNHGQWIVEPLPPQTLDSGYVIQRYRISRHD